MAPSAEAMRIWVDVIFTGAEGYQQFHVWGRFCFGKTSFFRWQPCLLEQSKTQNNGNIDDEIMSKPIVV